MSLFFGGKAVEAVLFSPLDGQITLDGRPASQAKIKLWIKWKDEKGEHFTYTADDNGFFHIPKQTATYKENVLAQIVITQEITIEYAGNSYLAWTLSKTNTHEFGELGGKPSKLICELAGDLEPIRTDAVLMGTICRWSGVSGKSTNT